MNNGFNFNSKASPGGVSVYELLGGVGEKSSISLDDLIAKSIYDGERFKRWQASGEPLRRTRFFHKVNGDLLPIEDGSASSNWGFFGIVSRVEMRDDSQLEIWECRDSGEPEFPVFKMPFSRVGNRREFNAIENLSPDISLILKARAREMSVDFKVAFEINNMPARNIELHTVPAAARVEPVMGEKAVAAGATSFMKRVVAGVREFFAEKKEDNLWWEVDVRTERIYQIGHLFRPPILAV